MVIVLRRNDERQHYRRLTKLGQCWVSFAEIIGVFGTGPITQFVWVNEGS